MTTGYKIQDQEALYYMTFQVVDWIDIFTRRVYRDIVLESLQYCQVNKGLQVFGYVIMSNHIHIIASSPEGKLSEIVRDFKKFTSNSIIETIKSSSESRKEWMLNRFEFNAKKHRRNSKYQLWTHENHAIVLFSNDFIVEKLEYIHNNPVRAGLVDKPEDYRYSSARNYAEIEGLLDVVFLDLPWKTYR